jgi:hypothetical protein
LVGCTPGPAPLGGSGSSSAVFCLPFVAGAEWGAGNDAKSSGIILMREFSVRYLWYFAVTSFASLSVASLHWISRFSFPARLSTIRPGEFKLLVEELYNALELYFFLIFGGLCKSNIIK